MDDHEQITVEEGVLGGGSRVDPQRHFRNLTHSEASTYSPFLGRLAEAVGGIAHRHPCNSRPMRELWFTLSRGLVR